MTQTYFSPRGHRLICVQPPGKRPILTVENYVKWYEMYLIQTDGSVKKVPIAELIAYTRYDEAAYCDHVPNPTAVYRMCETRGWQLDEVSIETIMGRWRYEYHNDPYDPHEEDEE